MYYNNSNRGYAYGNPYRLNFSRNYPRVVVYNFDGGAFDSAEDYAPTKENEKDAYQKSVVAFDHDPTIQVLRDNLRYLYNRERFHRIAAKMGKLDPARNGYLTGINQLANKREIIRV